MLFVCRLEIESLSGIIAPQTSVVTTKRISLDMGILQKEQTLLVEAL